LTLLNYAAGLEVIAHTTVDCPDSDYLMTVIDKWGHRPNPDKQSLATHDKLHQNFADETKPIVDAAIALTKEWGKEFYGAHEYYCKRFTPLDALQVEMTSMWGFHFFAGDGVGKHEHWPADFVFAYYFDDCDPLYFAELDHKIYPKAGDLYLWRGHLNHEAENPTSHRYLVSGSLNFKKSFFDYGSKVSNHNDFFPKKFLNEKSIT